MSIILSRLSTGSWSYGSSLACVRHCRLDPSSSQHGAYVDEEGVLHYQHIDAAAASTTTLLRFQLQFSAADGDVPRCEPISKPWAFEFVPGAPGDLLVVQEGSCRILYASLPKQGADSTGVFLFGSHTAPVRCLLTNGNTALSGCKGGVLKLWRLSDGQLADTCSTPDKGSVTALASLGPLLVAAGSSSSCITLYDLASGRLLAVQRLMAGPGAVQSMAAWLPPLLLAAANLAPGGPLGPDGGGVLSGASVEAADGCRPEPQPNTLLAVASTSGWLCVFGTPQHSTEPWSLFHSAGSLIAPGAHAQLAFSPDGTTLAVASPAAQVIGLLPAASAAASNNQPGAVSLYQVASSGSVLSALLPPLLLEPEQLQQLQELQLWHQWGLSSTPAGLIMLPSSGVQLLLGKQLQPMQALRMYMVPEIGPSQVLSAQRQLQPARSTAIRSGSALPGSARLQHPAGAADTVAAERIATSPREQQRQQQRDALAGNSSRTAASASGSSSSGQGRGSEADEALLLNIAERDLAEVASAIAAAAGPALDAELSAMLADAMSAGAAPGAPAATAAAAAVESASHAAGDGAADEQQRRQQGGQEEAAVPGVGAAAAAADAAAGDVGVEGGAALTSLQLPRTLPSVRSWRDPVAGAVVAAGQSADLPAAPMDLTALAESLLEEQEQLRQQQRQQQQQPEAPPAAQADRATDSPAAAGSSSEAADAGQELMSKSSLQLLLQDTEAGHMRAAAAEQQQQQRSASGAGVGSRHAPAADAAGVPAAAATAPAAGDMRAPAAVAAVALQANAEPDPQPRQLPAMLRQQRAPAAVHMAYAAAPAASAAAAVAPADRTQPARSSQAPGTTGDEHSKAVTPPDSLQQAATPGQQERRAEWQTQQQQEEVAPAPQQQRRRLTVQERLEVRRQEVLARKQQQQQEAQALAGAAAGSVRAMRGSSVHNLPNSASLTRTNEHPLAAAVQNSSRLLAAKVQEAERAPQVAVDPAGPAALKLAAARLADLDLPPEQQQYCYEQLPDLRDVPTPTHVPRLVPKQLDAHWVASRSLKPSMDTLFRPQDWQQGCVDPQVLLLPSWASPQEVVRQLLWPGMRS